MKKFSSFNTIVLSMSIIYFAACMGTKSTKTILANLPSLENRFQKILTDNDLKEIKINIDETEISLQNALEQKVNFIAAFEQALHSYLNDNTNEESPLGIVSYAIESYEQNVPKLQQHQNLLHKMINESGSICLVKLNDAEPSCYPPEEGESVTENWAFLLSIESLSDHLFWAIIPRNGEGAAYNYGFN